MKQDRLDIRYETLFGIIEERYLGLTPSVIESKVFDSDLEIKFEKDSNIDKEERIKKYIHAEVTRALKELSKKPRSEDKIEEYEYFDDDDIFACADEDVDELKEDDLKYYPHSLIIGIPKLNSNGKLSSINASYRLNKNIEFSIDNTDELKMASNFLYTLYSKQDETYVNSDMVKYITKDKSFLNNELSLLSDLFTQITLDDFHTNNNLYTFKFLLSLIELNVKVNIKIKTDSYQFDLQNISLEKITFNTSDSFDIKCSGIQFNLSSMKDIVLIESANRNKISYNIDEVEKILPNLSNELQDITRKFIDNFKEPKDAFFIDY